MSSQLDLVVTVVGIIYGIALILVTFLRSKYSEAFRIDALFIPNPTEATRPLNLVIGVCLVGYMVFSLF